ncbi:MAG: hypothetical protein LBB61_05045 [Treponema sp.]|jgi:cysteine desulfurase|nr:hypothetical protein [Treponema sp.]
MAYLSDLKSIRAATGSACNAGKGGRPHVLLALALSERDAKPSIRISYGRYNAIDEAEKNRNRG